MHFINMKTLLYVYLLVALGSSTVNAFEILERSFRTFSSSPSRNPRKSSNEDPSFEILEQKFNVFEQNRFNGKNKQKQQLHRNSKLEVSKVVDDSLTREPSFEILEQKFNVITPRRIENLDQQYKSRSILSNVAENNAQTRVIGSRRLNNNEDPFKSHSTKKTKVIVPRKFENLEEQLMSRSTSGNNASKDSKLKVIAPRRLDNPKKQFTSYSTSHNNAPKDLRARVIARRRLENFENEFRSSSSTDNNDNEFQDSEKFDRQRAARYSASKQFEPHVNTKEKISTSKKPRHDENVTRDKRLQNDQQITQAYRPSHNKNAGVSSNYHFHNSGRHSTINKLSKNADSRIGTKDLSIKHGTIPVQTYRRFGKPIIIRTPMVVRSNQPSTINEQMVEKKYMPGRMESTNQPSIGSSKTLPRTAILLKNKSKLHNLVKKNGQRRSPTSNVFSYYNKLHHNSEKEESVHTYNGSGPHRQNKPHPDEIEDTYPKNGNRAKTGSNKISIYSANYNSKPMYSDNNKNSAPDTNNMYEEYSPGTARFILKNTMQKYISPYKNQPPSPITILEEIIQKRNESSLKESEEKIVDYYERLKRDIYNILTHLGNKSMINDDDIVTNIDPTEYMMNDVVDIIRSFVKHESDKDVSEEVLYNSAKLILKYINDRQKIATNEYEPENNFVTPAPLKSSLGLYESNRYLGNSYPSEAIKIPTAKPSTQSMFAESNRKLQANKYYENLGTSDRFLMYNKMGTKNSLYNNKYSTNNGQLSTHGFETNLPSGHSSQLNNMLNMAMQNTIKETGPIRASEKHHPIHVPQETGSKASESPLYPIQSQIDYYNEPFPYHMTTRKPPVPIHSQIGFYNAPSPYHATTRKPPVFKASTRFTNLINQFTTASPISRLTGPVRLTNIPTTLFNNAYEITPDEKNSQRMDSNNVPALFRPSNAKINSNKLFRSPFKSFMGEIANRPGPAKQGNTALQLSPTVRSLEAIAGAGALALMAYGISHAIPALAAPAALLSPLRRSDSRHNHRSLQDRNHNRFDKQDRKPQQFVIPRPLTSRDASSNNINKQRKFIASKRMPLHSISQIMNAQNRQTAMGSKVSQAALAISEDKRNKLQAKKYRKKSPVLTGDLNFGSDPVKENKHFGKVSYSYDNLSNNPSHDDEIYVEKDQDSPYTEVIIKSKNRKRQENAHRGQQTRSNQLDRQPTRTTQIRSTNPTNRVRQTRREHNNRPITGKTKSRHFEPARIRSINPANSVKELLHKMRPKVSHNMLYLSEEDETNEIPYQDYNDVNTEVIDRNNKQPDSKTPTFENHVDNHRVEKTYKSFFEKDSLLRKRMSKVSTNTDLSSHEDEMKVEDVYLFEYYDDPQNSFDEMQTSGSSINGEKIPKELLRQFDYDEHSIQSMHDLGFNVYLVDSEELELGKKYSLDSADYIYASLPENNSYDDCDGTNECNGNEIDEDSSKNWRSISPDSVGVTANSKLESRNSRSQFEKSNRDHSIDSESSQNSDNSGLPTSEKSTNNFEQNPRDHQYHQIDSNFFTPTFSHLDKASSKKKRSSPHKKHSKTSRELFSDFQPYFPPVNHAATEKPQFLEPTYDQNNLNSFRDHWANGR